MFLQLSREDVKGETEREIITAWVQALKIKYYVTKILQTETDSKCRICKQFYKTVEQILVCPIFAKEQRIKRHNICKEIGLKLHKEHWYNHQPKSVKTSHEGKVKMLWNQQVWTNRTVPNNKLDIISRDNERGTSMLIDVAILGDRSVIKKAAEKILKYKDLI
jgi:hypothetical protein